LSRDRPGVTEVARIVGRLAAAGLGARHLDRAAGALQQRDRGKADARPKQIDETSNQQRHAGRFGHRLGSPISAAT
jgi:hypothetical protein